MSNETVELWREPRVVQVVGLARSTLWAMIQRNEFPRPIPIRDEGRAVGWPSNLVNAWIQDRIASARVKAA